MLKHWINREFKDGQIPYTVKGCTLIGPGIADEIPADDEIVEGDCVLMVRRTDERNGDKYARVVLAICSDGAWIRGIGVLDIVLH